MVDMLWTNMDFNCTVCRLAKLGCPYFKAGAKVHDLLNEIFVSRKETNTGWIATTLAPFG